MSILQLVTRNFHSQTYRGVFMFKTFVMFKALAEFYLALYRSYTWEPAWLELRSPDENHFHRRRFTQKYRNKLKIVRSLWFSMCLLVLAFPVLHFAVFVTLFTTFLSFCILDETE